MTVADRAEIIALVSEAVDCGSRQSEACEALGIAERTLQRWQLPKSAEDQRHGPLVAPANKLSEAERENIVRIASASEFCNRSPHQIVPTLADRGEYVASESSFYRVMKASRLDAHRGESRAPRQLARPRSYEATKPCQVFSWDITYLLSAIRGQYFYLYLFIDVFSRKAVGFKVHDCESMVHSADLLAEICEAEGIHAGQVSLHADNGGPMKGATMLATMQMLGVMPSFSRPSVSNDNPFSESLFKTLKYCPIYPAEPFETIEHARAWVAKFIDWYNNEHLHSGIGFTTPAARHVGGDIEILANRKRVYSKARENNPGRWSGDIRNWQRIDRVQLNCLKETESAATKIQIRKAA